MRRIYSLLLIVLSVLLVTGAQPTYFKVLITQKAKVYIYDIDQGKFIILGKEYNAGDNIVLKNRNLIIFIIFVNTDRADVIITKNITLKVIVARPRYVIAKITLSSSEPLKVVTFQGEYTLNGSRNFTSPLVLVYNNDKCIKITQPAKSKAQKASEMSLEYPNREEEKGEKINLKYIFLTLFIALLFSSFAYMFARRLTKIGTGRKNSSGI